MPSLSFTRTPCIRIAATIGAMLAFAAPLVSSAQSGQQDGPSAAAVKPPPGSRDGRAAVTGKADKQAGSNMDSRQDGETLQIGVADRKLMRDMAEAHWMEIKTAGLAAANSTNPEVRAYAEKVVEEHGSGLRQLRELADAGRVILPGGVEKEQAAQLRQLALQTGEQFDRMYLGQAAGREQAYRLFEEAGKNAQTPQLKAYATQFAPGYGEQLQEVRQMANQAGAAPAETGANAVSSGASQAAAAPSAGEGKK